MKVWSIKYEPKTVLSATIEFSSVDINRLLAVLRSHANEETYDDGDGKLGIVNSGCARLVLTTLEAALGLELTPPSK